MFPLIGSLVGAGASLLGNFFSNESSQVNTAATNAANAQLAAQQNAASVANQQAANMFNSTQAAIANAASQANFDSGMAWAREQYNNAQMQRDVDYARSELNYQRSLGLREEDYQRQIALEGRNAALQREFAQMGVRWRVADAMAAGLHPLYALGAPAVSYQSAVGSGSPVAYSQSSPTGHVGAPGSPGFTAAAGSAAPVSAAHFVSPGDTSFGRGLAAAGQDIGRAIAATRTPEENVMAALSVTRAGLENDLLRSQIAKNNAPGTGKGSPSGDPFQAGNLGDTNIPRTGSKVKDADFSRIAGPEGQPGSEPGAITDVGFTRTSTGWAPVPSKDVKERIEDNLIQETLHSIRNNVLPTVGINQQPPFPAPEGKGWWYHPFKQEYQLHDLKSWLFQRR